MESAVQRSDSEEILTLLRERPLLSLNRDRFALQVDGCSRNTVAAHIQLEAGQFASLARRLDKDTGLRLAIALKERARHLPRYELAISPVVMRRGLVESLD